MDPKILELAIIQAKKMDHGTVLPAHVLSAVLHQKRRKGDDVGWLIKNSNDALRGTTCAPSNKPPSLSERASYWLERSSVWMTDSELKLLQAECEGRVSLSNGPIEVSKTSQDLTLTSRGERELNEILTELDALVGLSEVKAKVRQLIADQEANRIRKESKKPTLPSSLNIIFSGPPGTGKTTVARLMAEIYRAIGVLKSGHLVETGRSELVAAFIGQTAIKTLEVATQALDGVLFIDEAYSLAPASPNDFGSEAIATLLQFMENNRGRVAVIAAGYKAEMDDFVNHNPGLRSRFSTFIEFRPYSPAEMLEIFLGLSAKVDLDVSPEVSSALISRFESIDTSGSLGNGRYVRELFTDMCSAINSRAYREGKLDIEYLSRFDKSDIPPIEAKFLNNRVLGFTK